MQQADYKNIAMKNLMKCLLLAVGAMILVPAVGNAQKLTMGSGATLSKIKYASVRMDFSQTVIKGKAMKDFLAKDASKEVGYWKEFDEDIKEITADFVKEFNDEECPMVLTTQPDMDVELQIVVKKVSKGGDHVWCDYVFHPKDSGEPLAIITMDSEDGSWGSFTNLMGDAFDLAGEKLAKYIRKAIKKGYVAE